VERLVDGEMKNVGRRKRSWPVARNGPIILLAELKKMTRLLVQRFQLGIFRIKIKKAAIIKEKCSTGPTYQPEQSKSAEPVQRINLNNPKVQYQSNVST
jgi:hypothetical protein